MAVKLTAEELRLFEEVRQERMVWARTFDNPLVRGLDRATSDIYPDPAHFVYELLQNADDAEATAASFILEKDVLYFKHNGKVRFNITSDETRPLGHINSITAYLSSKEDKPDGNKIGKFGLGFKSVFVYTEAPEIYDDRFWFRIEKQIIPTLLDADHPLREEGETLFVFKLKKGKRIREDIDNKLKQLNGATLFLHNLASISYEDSVAHKSDLYQEEREYFLEEENLMASNVTLFANGKEESLILFERDIQFTYQNERLESTIAIGFYLKEDGSLDSTTHRGVSCFFPTSENFELPYIIHAPFLLTSNRQNIKNDSTNSYFVKQLASLVADALLELTKHKDPKKRPLITSNLLNFVPHRDYSHYDIWNKVQPIYDAVTKLLRTEAVFLIWGNTYVKREDAYIAGNDDLRRLLTQEQLAELTRNPRCGFLRFSTKDEEHEYFLTNTIGIKSFTPEELAKKLSVAFMSHQDKEWVIKFYHFLKTSARLTWNPVEGRAQYIYGSLGYPMRYAPIILNQEGKWVPPFVKLYITAPYSADNERANVFMPIDSIQGHYSFVNKEYLDKKNQAVLDFFNELGIKQPDRINYIETEIISHYNEETLNNDILLNDFESLYTALQSQTISERKETIAKLKPHIKFVTLGDKFNSVTETYDDTPDLRTYFRLNEGSVIDYDFYSQSKLNLSRDELRAFFKEFGMWNRPRLLILNKGDYDSRNWNYKSRLQPANCTSVHDVNDSVIDSFDEWLNHGFTEEASMALWRLLPEMPLSSYLKAKVRYFYRTYKTYEPDSTWFYKLKKKPWICINGRIFSAEETFVEDMLSAGYANNVALFQLLGIVKKNKSIIELGGSIEQQEAYELGQQLQRMGATLEEFEEFKRHKEEKRLRELSKQEEAARQMESRGMSSFDEPAATTTTLDEMFSGPVKEKPKEKKTQSNADSSSSPDIERLRQQLEEDNEKKLQQASLRQQRQQMEKYSFEWFMAGLQQEYASTSSESRDEISHSLSISFSKVKLDLSNPRIFILDDASRDIPQWIEDIDNLTVNFTFNNRTELAVEFEVASVRDHTLRLKAKAGDEKMLAPIQWERDCTNAKIDLNNPINLIDNLRRAFQELELEGFNLKEELTNHLKFIFGPPGTGKTTYLAREVISRLMKQNEECRILVLTPTNKACDVIAKKLLEVDESSRAWMSRFVASDDTELDNDGFVCDRESDLYELEKCCLISTIARLPFDGFEGSGKTFLREIEWDYIVIDEASMISLPQIVYALYQFEETEIIIAGDPMQIAPIDTQNIWGGENIYTMVELDSFKNPTTIPIQFEVINLTTQYRSIPAIGQLFSQFAYEGQLKHHRNNDSQLPLNIPELSLKPLTFIPFKVENIDNMYAAKKLSGSNIHIYSAVLSSELMRFVAKSYVKNNPDKELRIGVICPYRSQSQLITKLIEQMPDIPSTVTVNVGTIHSFQGDECNIVFAVFNPPSNLKSGASEAHINNRNIINVAISRAQDYLCVLMPSADCEGFSNLIELNRLGKIAKNNLRETTGVLNPFEVERLVFGSTNYLYNNIFVTSHQTANVYTKPAAHYEVRCDDKSIDIQVDEAVGLQPTLHFPQTTTVEEHLEREKPIVLQMPTKREPEFKIIVMGEYRVGIVGKYNPIIDLLRKLGGVPSKNITYKGRLYGQGYSIQKYNVPRLLRMLKDDDWNTDKLEKEFQGKVE